MKRAILFNGGVRSYLLTLLCMLGLFLPLWAEEIALTSDSYHHYLPQWSPDGNWIVYKKDDATGYNQIYKVSSAGGTETPLTSDSYYHEYPQWSPDGDWIVYYRYDATGKWQIYKVSSAGGEETALTGDGYEHERPQWSPDGNWIVYHKYDWTYYAQIYKVPSEVGIEEVSISNEQLAISNLQVYPNPFTTVVSVVVRGFSLAESDPKRVALQTTDFSPGVYFLKAEGYAPVKIVKLR